MLHGAPTGLEFKVTPEHFRTLVLERLRLPLQSSGRLSASVVPFWTCKVAIEQLAPDPEGCGPEQLAQNALWPECAGRQVPQSGATCAFGT